MLAACDGKLDENLRVGRTRLAGCRHCRRRLSSNYNTGDEIHGLPLEEVEDGKVFHAGTTLADDDRVLTSGGRVLCATATGQYRG